MSLNNAHCFVCDIEIKQDDLAYGYIKSTRKSGFDKYMCSNCHLKNKKEKGTEKELAFLYAVIIYISTIVLIYIFGEKGLSGLLLIFAVVVFGRENEYFREYFLKYVLGIPGVIFLLMLLYALIYKPLLG